MSQETNRVTESQGHTMTRTILGAISASAMLILSPLNTANAADLSVKAAPPAPVFSWTGLYIGGNVGGAWGHSSWCTDATAGNCTVAPIDVVNESSSGITGGAQFGFRWQMPSNIVVGLEGMFDYLNISQTAPSVAFAGRTRTTTFTDLESITGQLGLAVGRGLIYGKGGWAATTVGLDANNTNPGGFDLNVSQWVTGWTAGGGLEYMVLDNISLGVEYDYYRFNVPNFSGVTNTGGIAIAPCSFCNFGTTSVQTLLGRVNFKFPG